MKKIIHKFCIALALVFAASCTDDFSDINSTGTPTMKEANGDFYSVGIYAQSLQTSVILVSPINAYQYNENLAAQPYARYLTITKGGWIQNFGSFNASIAWLNSLFNDQMSLIYSAWFEYRRQLEKIGMSDSYLWAWAEVLRVAAVHRTTDVYGPLPYSQIKSNTEGSLYVAYDSQEDVYKGMFADLDKAIATLTTFVASGGKAEGLSVYDKVYGGDFSKWLKFANSLKMRMAMRLSYVDATLAKQYFMEAFNHPGGLISTVADNAQIALESNPLYTMQGAYADTRACAEILCYMKGYGDKRLEKYFVPVASDGGSNADQIAGMRLGISHNDDTWSTKNFSVPRVEQKDPIVWMTAAEVAFLKAEAAAVWKWLPETDAEGYYNEGIRLSFSQWGASGADTYIADATSTPAAYNDDPNNAAAAPSSITIKWDETADTETKQERIITQKWIATFPVGVEGWAEQRRTGFPRVFNIPVNGNTDGSLKQHGASRIPYAPSEQLNNGENYRNAISLLNGEAAGGSGDTYGTRLWWDKKANKAGW